MTYDIKYCYGGRYKGENIFTATITDVENSVEALEKFGKDYRYESIISIVDKYMVNEKPIDFIKRNFVTADNVINFDKQFEGYLTKLLSKLP